MVSKGGVKAGRAFVVIGAIDKTGLVLGRISQRMKAFSQRVGALGRGLATGGVIAAAPLAIATKIFASFDDSMRKVEARSKGSEAEMDALRKQAKELGRETSFTARQVAELQAKLAQKGFNRGQIKAMTKDVLNLARAAGEGSETDTVLAADLLSGNIRAFGKDAEDAQNVADVFTTAVNNSNFSLQGLMDAMAEASPVSSKFGISMEDTVATLAGMTNINIQATKAGTAFKTMLLRLTDATARGKFNKNLEQATGATIDFVDEAGNLRRLPDILFDIGEATRDLGSAEAGKLTSELFGLRGILGATALGEGRNAFGELTTLLKDADGAAADTAATMDKGLGGAFRLVLSALEGVAIEIGESLAPSLVDLSKDFIGNLNNMAEWIEGNREAVVTIGKIIVGVVAAGVALIALGLVLNIVASAVGILGVAFTVASTLISAAIGLVTFMLTPMGAIVAGILTIVALIAKASNAFSSLAAGFSSIGDTVSDTFQGIVEALGAGEFEKAFELLINGLELSWLQFVGSLKDAWFDFKKAVTGDVGRDRFTQVKNEVVDLQTKIEKLQKVEKPSASVTNQIESLKEDLLPLIQELKTLQAEKDRISALKTKQKAIRKEIKSRIEEKALASEAEAEQAALEAQEKKTLLEIKAANKAKDEADLNARREATQTQLAAKRKEIADALESKKKKKEKDVDLRPANVVPSISQGLEAGTVEAAKKFHENRFSSEVMKLQAAQLEEQKKTNELLKQAKVDPFAEDDGGSI